VASFATLRPDQHHKPAVEVTGANEPGLAIVESIVHYGCGVSGKHLVGAFEIQTAMLQREIALHRSKVISIIKCTPNKYRIQSS